MSGVTRHPRLPAHSCSGCCPDCSACHRRTEPCPPRPSALANAVTLLVALGMAVGLVVLLAAYLGVIA